MSNSQTFDNQSFDYQEPQSSSSRKRPLPSSHHDNLFAKAHRASEEAGLVPLEHSPGFKVLPCREFDKMKDAQNMGYHKKSCTYQSHRTKQGSHKKLCYHSSAHERVTARCLLESRINVTDFERAIRSQFSDLYCYNYAEIIVACYPAIDYRKRWIVLEEDGSGRRFIQHRSLTEDTKANIKMSLSRSESCTGIKNKLIRNRVIPTIRHLSMYDVLMSVYGGEFYRKNNLVRQCGPICDLADRMIELYRCREKALISPITSMITQQDCKLTMEQKHVVIGILHQATNVDSIREQLARIFPQSFSPRSTIDILAATFGSYKQVCIETQSKEEDPSERTVILGEKFSCQSVFKAMEDQRNQEAGKVIKKGKKKKGWKPQRKSKGQVIPMSFSKGKGNLV